MINIDRTVTRKYLLKKKQLTRVANHSFVFNIFRYLVFLEHQDVFDDLLILNCV